MGTKNTNKTSLFIRIIAVILGVVFMATGNAMEGNELAYKIAVVGWCVLFLLITFKLIQSIGIKNLLEQIRYIIVLFHKVVDKISTSKRMPVLSNRTLKNNNGPLGPGLPPLNLLPAPPVSIQRAEQERTGKGYARRINTAFRRCGLIKKGEKIEVLNIETGPGSVRLTIKLLEGMKIDQLTAMSNNLANSFGVASIQVESGGRASTAALIIPFTTRLPVYLKNIMATDKFNDFNKKAELPIVLGVNDTWAPIMLDLVTVKHLLIAGATGSGKSFCLNTIIVTLLMCVSPEKLKFVFIDPKMVELTPFKKFPHTMKVATSTKDALQVLTNLTKEMDRRFEIFTKHSVKNIQHYWKKTGDRSLEYIVVIIDELADLMMASKQIEKKSKKEDEEEITGAEYSIQRLTQKARAAGIHLIVATQRPDVKVVTGTIKSNLPSRISFYLRSQHDYRTILDEVPSFDLMGKGDGLALIEGQRGKVRFQGACVGLDESQIEDAIIKLEKFWVSKTAAYTKTEEITSFDKKEKNVTQSTEELLPVPKIQEGNSSGNSLKEYIKKIENMQVNCSGYNRNKKDVNDDNEIKIQDYNLSGHNILIGKRIEKINVPGQMVLLPDLLTIDKNDVKKQNELNTEVRDQKSEELLEMRKAKKIIAETWLEQINAGVPIDQLKAPSIRKMRSYLKVKQDTIIELYDQLVKENWLQQPGAPRKPFTIIASKDMVRNYLD